MRGEGAGLGLAAMLLLSLAGAPAFARQAPAAAAAGVVRQVGTVKAIDAGRLTLAPDAGEAVTVVVSAETRVLELPPGSTDLKGAQPGVVGDLVVGDRVLVTGTPGAAATEVAARRIVLMKSAAIAQQREAEQAEWAHSSGGTVEAVDAASGQITVSSRGQTLAVLATPATMVRRYAADSARYADAKKGTLADVQVGDQLRVRGERTGDTVHATEMVSGRFAQMSGHVVAVDATAMTLTLRDAKTQQPETVKVAARTEVHRLPAEVAAQFAARSKAASGAAGGATRKPGAGGADAPAAGGRRERDLGQAVAALPELPLSDLKAGDAVVLVASEGAGVPTAVTVVSGVEPMLAASASGGAETSLAPWSMGGGGEAGATQ